MKVEKKLAYGPNIIPLIGSAIKIQLYHTPEMFRSGPINESQTIVNAAKTAINDTNDDSFNLFIQFHLLIARAAFVILRYTLTFLKNDSKNLTVITMYALKERSIIVHI